MTDRAYSVLVADADPSVRRDLTNQLSAMGCTVFEAADGGSALRTLKENDIRVVVCELYLETGAERDLISAIRSTKGLRRTRTVAHTRFRASKDRDWARRAGADAFLLRPARYDRLSYVVGRVAKLNRRDSLDVALRDIESGSDRKTASIIVGHAWWTGLTPAEQSPYRKRAKKAGMQLLSNKGLTDNGVEVRARRTKDDGPYRARPQIPQ